MKKLKKYGVIYYVSLPFLFVWVYLGLGIMKIGDALHWLGNAMTFFKADTSIGTVHFE